MNLKSKNMKTLLFLLSIFFSTPFSSLSQEKEYTITEPPAELGLDPFF